MAIYNVQCTYIGIEYNQQYTALMCLWMCTYVCVLASYSHVSSVSVWRVKPSIAELSTLLLPTAPLEGCQRNVFSLLMLLSTYFKQFMFFYTSLQTLTQVLLYCVCAMYIHGTYIHGTYIHGTYIHGT